MLKFILKPIPQAFGLATIITGILVIAQIIFTTEPVNIIETLAVFTSFACVWLVNKQIRFNYFIGIVSTALLAYVFWEANLLGSMALNLYLVPTLIYGWFVWGKDTHTKPVEHVKLRFIPIYTIVTLATYGGALLIITALGGTMGVLDSWLLVGSILAQYLLDRKKIDAWTVYILINIVSVYVYFNNGLYLVAAQFAIFLINAIYAYFLWRKSIKK